VVQGQNTSKKTVSDIRIVGGHAPDEGNPTALPFVVFADVLYKEVLHLPDFARDRMQGKFAYW
jgi:hypothetical protein